MNGGNDFLQYALEMLAPLGTVRARRMFGGYGLYCGDLFFGIIADDTLYLKVDDSNRAEFQRAGSQPFRYSRRRDRATLDFYRAPDETLEASQVMLPWARSSLACALRARAEKLAAAPRMRRTQRSPGARRKPGR